MATGRVRGLVWSRDDKPVAGASIQIEGSSYITKKDGYTEYVICVIDDVLHTAAITPPSGFKCFEDDCYRDYFCEVGDKDVKFSVIGTVRKPEITSIGTKETPKLCEPVQFESKVDYNDAGWKKTDQGTGLLRAWWEYSLDDKEWISECADELSWIQFSDQSWPRHTFTEEHAGIRHIRHTVENKYGEKACAIIDNFRFEDANGFIITVDPTLNGKNMVVYHVTPIVGTDLYYFPFSYVGGEWNSISADKVYNVPVGNIASTPKPAFDKTINTGYFADGIDCVVLVESADMVGFSIFKKEDVFKLRSDVPNCINLKTTSSDVITDAVMGPVCDLFKIPRGSECESFWAEFYDPVFIANYASILKTGKDTLGNSRELTAFDHLALPFAVLGVVAPNIPFGKFVSEGLEAFWAGGRRFSDAAFNWMRTVVLDAPGEIIDKDVFTFMEAIIRLSGDHIDEVMALIVAGKFDAAKLKINEYLPVDFGSVGWRDWHKFNDALRAHLGVDQYDQLMSMVHGFGPQVDSVIKTASKTDLTASDVDDLAKAAKEIKVMDEATSAVLNSLKDVDTASIAKIDEIKNILKNSPELSAKLVTTHKSILDDVVSGGDISEIYVRTILNHAELVPSDVVGLFKSIDESIVSELSDGTYKQVLGNFIDSNLKHYDVVKALGDVDADNWVKNNVELARKALDSADPAKMADIPHSIFDGIDNAAPLIDDLPDTSAVDEIIDITEELTEVATTSWKDRGLDYIDKILGSLFRKAKGAPKETVHYADSATRYAKWKSIYRNLEDWQKFTFWTMVVWGTYETATFFGGFVVPKILGIFPGQASGRQLGHNDNIEAARWQCKAAWDYQDAEKLEAAIGVLETTINNAEDHLNANEKEFKLNKEYAGFAKAIEVAKLGLDDYKEKLATLTPLGTIRCTSNQTGFHVFIDDESKGHSFTNTVMVIDDVKAGSHKVKIEKGPGYTPIHCEETVAVTESGVVTVDCQMTKIEECAEITNAKIYIDPLSPLEGDTLAINGSADSFDTIEESGWVWNFGDGSDEVTGQAVTHKYKKAGAYKVELTVTNDCGMSATSTRVITVTKEEPKPESTTLTIDTPVDEAGKELYRYFDVDIWVDDKLTGCHPPHALAFGTGVSCDCKDPWNLVKCELGTHTVTLKKAGYEDLSKSFSLKKDRPEWWRSPRMVKSTDTSFIDCKTTPTDAEIFIDGVYYGKTNKKIEISPGEKWIVFKKEGYDDCDKPVTVAKGETITAECVMKGVVMHDVEITIPDGATLFIDGNEIKTTQVSRLSTILRDIRR